MTVKSSVFISLLFSALIPAGSASADASGEPGRDSGKPNPLKNVYFGEQHLHTTNSPDAFVVGVRQSWDEAYQWTQGKEVKLSTSGETIRKSTPYDFVAITDHAEYFGIMPSLIDPKDPLFKTDLAKKLRDKNADPHDPDSAINQILRSLVTGKPMTEFVSVAPGRRLHHRPSRTVKRSPGAEYSRLRTRPTRQYHCPGGQPSEAASASHGTRGARPRGGAR